MNEEWRVITGVPQYLVSSLGRVRHIEAEKCRNLRPAPSGYVYVRFWTQKKLVTRTVHSLVAAAFIGLRPRGLQVRHKNGTRGNNAATNLCYGTAKENGEDKVAHGRSLPGERNPNAVVSDAVAAEIVASYVPKSPENNQYALARRFGLSQAQVNNIVHGKQRRRAA